jgi:methylmalonyl-CoA mutase
MTENNVQKLFEEFPGITTEEWDEQIKKDLKGADYDKKLIWKTQEGFNLKPFYREENLKDLNYLNSCAGNYPFIRGNKINNNRWVIQQNIEVNNIVEANRKALLSFSGGCSAVCFVTNHNKLNGQTFNFSQQSDFSKLLNGINPEKTIVNFCSGFDSPVLISLMDEEISNQNLNKNNVFSHFDYDPIGFLTLNGMFFKEDDSKKALDILLNLYGFVIKQLPSVKFIGIHGNYFNNSGADALQELAFSLALANEYIAYFTENGFNVEDITKYLNFNFSIGSNYFIEIAKLRAARFLFANIIKAYEPSSLNHGQIFIHSVTSDWNKTIYDPHVNILRCTTEAMSAIIGGCDSLSIRPFDFTYKNPDDFSERVAKNIQIILKEEANFDKVIDPAGGSYYIENLTNIMIDKSWELFNIIEEKGGYIQAFKDGFIQNEIRKSREKHFSDIANKKEIILGTNQYPNLNEKAKDIIQHPEAISEGNLPQLKIAEPLMQYRGAEKYEKIRLFTESTFIPVPKVFLLTFGNLSMRKARAAFSTNLFGCGGFEIIENPCYSSIDDGVNAAIDSKAEIVVICSSDEEYRDTVPEFINKLNNKTILVLAGYPNDLAEKFKQLGLNYFIHIKSDVIEILTKFQKLILEKRQITK